MSRPFLLMRGKGSLRRKAHITTLHPLTGAPTMQPLCGQRLAFNMTSNVTWGCGVCKRCARAANRWAS